MSKNDDKSNMNKAHLIAAIAKETGFTKVDAEKALNALTKTIEDALIKNHKVNLIGFGSFSVSSRKATEGRNPRTGEKIKIAASKQPRFKPGKTLKDAINGAK
ncbi:HU family DNA-binding protein [Rickettsiales bacterium LUAb2]